MLPFRNPRGDDDGTLLVPVLPGAVLRSVQPADAPAGHSVALAAAIAAVPALLAVAAVLLFARGSGPGGATSAAAGAGEAAAADAPQAVALRPPTPAPVPRRSPAEVARARALELASHLPVTLASTALLRVGTSLYAVGGTTRDGKVSNRIWQLDLESGEVTAAGTFVEPLTDSAATARDGVLYLAGGWTGAQVATGVLRWTPARSSSLVTRLPVAHRGGTAAFVGGRLYVAGGAPQRVFEVDVGSGSVTTPSAAPRLPAADANLDYLIAATRNG